MIGDVNLNGYRRKSPVWSFFKKLSQKHAQCNHCHGIYKTTHSNLLKHVRKKHSDAFAQFKNQEIALLEENTSPMPFTDETSTSSWPAVEVLLQTDESESGQKSADKDPVWGLFTRMDDTIAECNLCQIKLPFKDSLLDLIEHKEVEHSGVLLKGSPEKEASTNGLCSVPVKENHSLTSQSSKKSNPNDEPAAETSRSMPDMKLKRSPTWQYFILIDKTYARCKICGANISHSSFSNLMRHVVRKHPLQLLASTYSGEENDAEKNANENSGDLSGSETQDHSTISDVEEDSDEGDETRKNIADAPSFDQASGLRRSKRIKSDHSLQEDYPMVNDEAESRDEGVQSSQGQNGVLEDNTATGEGKRAATHSTVWKNFTKLKNGRLQCKLCGNTMFKTTGVSNLWRHLRRVHSSSGSARQKKTAASREKRHSRPIIHTFKRDTQSTSEQETDDPPPACGGPEDLSDAAEEQSRRIAPSASPRVGRAFRKSPTAHDTTGCPFSERLVRAVEEGNHLLRSLQGAVERQGQALDRLVACLEGMNCVQNNNA
ncbi:unnamed protein product [Larinioides sclopetarius]|uniref:BED-type domain-containing protein n=1 Tax=Larinioides sclopetarius TaxID=280406 RepID=A0AAV2AT81_9ARAC